MNKIFNHIFNQINVAVAYFNSNTNLEFFNDTLINLWKLNPESLTNVNVTEFLEILREKGVYPEKDDFKGFCNQILSYFNNLENNLICNLILPNGKNIEEEIIPYQQGLIFIWEDTTNKWELTYNLNSFKNLYNRIVDKVPFPIMSVGSNGLIDDFNRKLCDLWDLSIDFFQSKPHISEFFQKIETLHNNTNTTGYLTGLSLARKEFNYKLSLNNNLTIELHGFPLPNGNNFIVFRSTSKTLEPIVNLPKIETSFNQLKDNMVFEMQSLINTPLTTIIGFADILKQNYFGELNLRQKEYLEKIINQAEFMQKELEYKVELLSYNDEKENNIEYEDVDINQVIAIIMHQIKPKITQKQIKINLQIGNNINIIKSNQIMLTKLFNLLLLYIIEQNTYNSVIDIELKLKNNTFSFTIKDGSKLPLLSTQELQNRFDLNLALKLISLLKGSYNVLGTNRAQRTLVISFNINN